MSCSHFKFVLEESHRHYINSLKHNNCVLCLVNQNGAMTQDEIAKILGITKVRVGQIEFSALRKFKKKMINMKNQYDSI